MAKDTKQPPRRRPQTSSAPSFLEQARDEMFQHIMQCGVTGSEPEDQKEWFDATMNYLSERWHELTPAEMAELRATGERFAKPAKTTAGSQSAA